MVIFALEEDPGEDADGADGVVAAGAGPAAVVALELPDPAEDIELPAELDAGAGAVGDASPEKAVATSEEDR
jgi:hypothetical protein